MFSEFIWYISIGPERNKGPVSSRKNKGIKYCINSILLNFKKVNTFIKGRNRKGSGSFGTVYGGKWVNEKGKEIPAACKIFRKGTSEDLDKEFQALRQLDHLFVIKCFGTCNIESEG